MKIALVVLLVAGFTTVEVAKCPIGTVSIKGELANIPSDSAPLLVKVTLRTQNGSVSKSASSVRGNFKIDVPFSTLTSYSPLSGHRCKTIPTSLTVGVYDGNHLLVGRNVDVQTFLKHDTYLYELKRPLIIDVSRLGGPHNPHPDNVH